MSDLIALFKEGKVRPGDLVWYRLDVRRDPADPRVMVERKVTAEILRINPVKRRATIKLYHFPERRAISVSVDRLSW